MAMLSLSFLLLLFVSLVTSAPFLSRRDLTEYVILFDSSKPEDLTLSRLVADHVNFQHGDVRYQYNNPAFSGFSAWLDDETVEDLRQVPGITLIHEVHTLRHATLARGTAPWGLQKVTTSGPVSGSPESLNYQYYLDWPHMAESVDVYIIDTGINVNHLDFGGRAHMDWPNGDALDEFGHGTHVAGIATGGLLGLASKANVHGYKALGNDGTGDTSTIISAVDLICQAHETRKIQSGFVGSVINLSLGGLGEMSILNKALANATTLGIHVVVAAGNNADDACRYSPSSNGGDYGPLISVSSIGMDNKVSYFSNTGPCVDVYAPGESILSAWYTSDRAVQILSGTSMATPHVTGMIAAMIRKRPYLALDPAGMKAAIASLALPGMVSGDNVTTGDHLRLANTRAWLA